MRMAALAGLPIEILADSFDDIGVSAAAAEVTAHALADFFEGEICAAWGCAISGVAWLGMVWSASRSMATADMI